LVAGVVVIVTLILMGGDLRMFYDVHAIIIIFGGSFSATLIRFPLSTMMHGLPLGARFAFTLSNSNPRDLVEEIAGLAEIARKSARSAWKNSRRRPVPGERHPLRGGRLRCRLHPRQPGARPRQLLTHLDEGQKIYRAIGDCAPAFGMSAR
jgi:chemotaxis protein MotA